MNWLNRIYDATLCRRRKLYTGLAEEMHMHLEEKIEQFQRDGLSREEAEQAARRAFGNTTLIEERSREVWQCPNLESIWADVKYALRQLRRSPGFAVTAILVLALGIAASVSIFAFVNAALLKPLPYQHPSRLVAVFEKTDTCKDCSFSYADYLDMKRGNTVFSDFEAWQSRAYLLKSAAGVQALRAGSVSGDFFRTLGVTPILGRGFTAADDTPAAPRTVLLPYATWQNFFGGRADILGQAITLDDATYTVIGVLPRDFYFPPRAAELWTTIHDSGPCEKDRACRAYTGLARLKDGVSLQTASSNLEAITAQLEKDYPETNRGQNAFVTTLTDSIVGGIRPLLIVLLSGAGLLLLIACVNVASLLLVRAESRRREMAVRGALGAPPRRLLRQLVTEGIVLVAISAVFGLAAAYEAIQLLFKLIPERVLRGMPYFQRISFDWRTLTFAGAVSLLAVVVCSVAPSLRLSVSDLRADLADGKRSSGNTWKRFGSNLVVVELAIAMVLLSGAGLLGKSFYHLLHVDLNFDPAHLATLEIDANSGYDTATQQIQLSRNIISRISKLPGVLSAGVSSSYLPVTCNCDAEPVRALGKPWNGEHRPALQHTISADYLATLHAALISGRFFTEADDASKSPVVIINRAMAQQFFPNEDPIGHTIGDKNLSPQSRRRIVGVVDDIREGALDDPILPAVYSPFNQNPSNYFFLVVRTAQRPAAMLPSLAAAIHQAAPAVGVRNEYTMVEHIADSGAAYTHSSSAWLVGSFAALALLLGVIGLYGVIAFSVSQRTREIGVRMALGAQRSAVYRLILGEAGLLVLLGLVFGLFGSLQTGFFLRSFLFGVRSWDISIFVTVSVLLTVFALAACYIPARRAARTDPMQALRAE